MISVAADHIHTQADSSRWLALGTCGEGHVDEPGEICACEWERPDVPDVLAVVEWCLDCGGDWEPGLPVWPCPTCGDTGWCRVGFVRVEQVLAGVDLAYPDLLGDVFLRVVECDCPTCGGTGRTCRNTHDEWCQVDHSCPTCTAPATPPTIGGTP